MPAATTVHGPIEAQISHVGYAPGGDYISIGLSVNVDTENEHDTIMGQLHSIPGARVNITRMVEGHESLPARLQPRISVGLSKIGKIKLSAKFMVDDNQDFMTIRDFIDSISSEEYVALNAAQEQDTLEVE